MSIPHNFMINGKSLVRRWFVETGTYLGGTSRAALAAGFQEVRTVEYHWPPDRLHVLKDLLMDPRVRIYGGSSPDMLPKMCRPDVETTIYLDGHFSGVPDAPSDPKYGECPLLAELKVITEIAWETKPWIAIDDAVNFERPWSEDLKTRFIESHWPTMDQIAEALPGYTLEVIDGVIYSL
jgi:hypothetical protein